MNMINMIFINRLDFVCGGARFYSAYSTVLLHHYYYYYYTSTTSTSTSTVPSTTSTGWHAVLATVVASNA